MAKVSFANLKLKVEKDIKTIDFNNTQIEVLQYLPISDKKDLIDITLQKAEENGLYDPIQVDMYFHLHIVYMYSNLSFTDKQKEDEFKLYDMLESNGLIAAILKGMDEHEYSILYTWLEDKQKKIMKYKNTAGAVLQSVINDLPRSAQAAAEIVEHFDPNKYQEVINFATAANGGRPVMGVNKNKDISRPELLD